MQIEATSPRNDATTPIQASDIVEVKPSPPPLLQRVNPQADLTTVDVTGLAALTRSPAGVHDAPTVHRFSATDDILAAMARSADDDQVDPIEALEVGPVALGRRRSAGWLVLAGLALIAVASWGYGLHRWLSGGAADGDQATGELASAKIPIVWTEAEQPRATTTGPKEPKRSARQPSERPPAAAKRSAGQHRRARDNRGHPLLAFEKRTPAVRRVRRAKQRRVQRQLARALRAMKKRDYRRAKARASAALRLRPVDRRSRRLAIAIKRRATRVQKKVTKRVRRAKRALARRRWWRARGWADAALRLSPRHPTARRIKRRAQARIRSARVRSRKGHG